jgi:hypothetical protein
MPLGARHKTVMSPRRAQACPHIAQQEICRPPHAALAGRAAHCDAWSTAAGLDPAAGQETPARGERRGAAGPSTQRKPNGPEARRPTQADLPGLRATGVCREAARRVKRPATGAEPRGLGRQAVASSNCDMRIPHPLAEVREGVRRCKDRVQAPDAFSGSCISEPADDGKRGPAWPAPRPSVDASASEHRRQATPRDLGPTTTCCGQLSS